jgi:hypothetical protein
MVPHLERLHETINTNNKAMMTRNAFRGRSGGGGDVHHTIDAVVISCGANNAMYGHSPKQYGEEVRDLISSIRRICTNTSSTKVLMTGGLADFFALMPASGGVPYPLSKVLSWHSKKLQKEMESIVSELQNKYSKGGDEDKHQNNHITSNAGGEGRGIAMSCLPKIEEILKNPQESDVLNDLTYDEKKKALALEDFYADDKYHPSKLGYMVAGKVHVKTFLNFTWSC